MLKQLLFTAAVLAAGGAQAQLAQERDPPSLARDEANPRSHGGA